MAAAEGNEETRQPKQAEQAVYVHEGKRVVEQEIDGVRQFLGIGEKEVERIRRNALEGKRVNDLGKCPFAALEDVGVVDVDLFPALAAGGKPVKDVAEIR